MNPIIESPERVTLDWIKTAVSVQVSPEFAAGCEVDIEQGPWGMLVYRMTGHVLADKLPPDVVTERQTFRIEVPASPWQQFKQINAHRWWMRPLVARRPVRTVEHAHTGEITVNLERFHAYPQARMERQMGRPVLQYMLSREIRWDES